jgi:hypothetical protein
MSNELTNKAVSNINVHKKSMVTTSNVPDTVTGIFQ